MKLTSFLFITLCSQIAWSAHLKDLAKKIYIGSATTAGELNAGNDPQYKTILAEEFQIVTPGNEMKWDATEGTRGQQNYQGADSIVNFAKQHGLKVRGHTFVWHNQVPGWVNGLQGNKAELEKAMVTHITNELTHFKGVAYAWDVVNECISDDGNGLRQDSVWYRTFHDNSFIKTAFKTAHSVDPNTKLYINDYSIEGKNKKSDALYNLVKELKSEGIPIHGVGFQAHLIVGQVPQDIQSNLQRFADLGVDVAITELDIRIKLPANQQSLEQQGKDYAKVVSACLAVSRCVGVTVWDFSDNHSWIPGVFPGYGAANIFDSNYKPKPAYNEIMKVLR